MRCQSRKEKAGGHPHQIRLDGPKAIPELMLRCTKIDALTSSYNRDGAIRQVMSSSNYSYVMSSNICPKCASITMVRCGIN